MEAMMACLSTSCIIKVMTKTNKQYRKVIGFALFSQHHWLKKILATFSSNQYQCVSFARVFPRFASAACNYFEF